jgi:hypothetical protein
MSELKALQQKKEAIIAVARLHGLHNVRIFGSVAREEDTPQSDIDLLVDLDENCTLLEMGGGYRQTSGTTWSQGRYCDRTWATLVPTRTDHEGGTAIIKDDKLYLIHITESINKIESYTWL